MNVDHRDFISAKFMNYKVEFNFLLNQTKETIWSYDSFNQWFSSEAYLKYLFSCHAGIAERSLCFIVKNQKMILSRITLHLSRDKSYLYSADNYVLLPDFNVACPKADQKVILACFFDLIFYLKNYYQNLNVKLVLPPTTELTGVLDLVETCNYITFDQSVLMVSQLNADQEIKINRKSYRNLINFSAKTYQFKIMYGVHNFRVEEYCNFHKEVSKKQTRDLGSWLEQENWIKNREAFIVECRDKNKLIGYTFIRIFNDCGFYFSGVYSRDKKYKGIGHGCLYKALCFSNELELHRVFLGNAAMRADLDKLKTITQFKLGFSNKLDFRVCLNWN